MSGFITIQRNLWDHPEFKSGPMTEREAWIWMLSKAAWKDTKTRVGSDIVDVPRGSFVITLRELQHNMLWLSDKKVRGFLKRLENGRMIGLKMAGRKNAKKTHITICNYGEYQSLGRRADAPMDAPRTHRGRTEDAVKEPYNHKPYDDDTARVNNANSTDRDLVLHAMGHEPDAMTPSGQIIGNQNDVVELERWKSDLGLSIEEICNVIKSKNVRPPPRSFKYFTQPMQELAAAKSQPKLKPIEGGTDARTSNRSGPDTTGEQLRRVVTTAANGTSGQDWG